LTFNEALLTTSTPTAFNFSGATVSTAVVSGSIVTLTLSTAIAAGASATIVYSGATIKDVAGNNAAGFSTTVTVAAGAVGLAMQTRTALFDEVVVGTYKHNGAANAGLGATTSTRVFTGDKIYTISPTTLTGNMDFGLELTTTTAPGDGLSTEIGVRVNFNSGLAAIDGGGISLLGSPLNTPQPTDEYRISRTGSAFKLQGKRGAGAWVDIHAYTFTSTADLSPVVVLNKTNDQVNVTLN
jgi:hypothetical protein